MLKLVSNNRTYDAETVAVMTAAYDRAVQSFAARISGIDDVRETLARIILWHVDRGERDARRLSDIAFQELTESDRSATG